MKKALKWTLAAIGVVLAIPLVALMLLLLLFPVRYMVYADANDEGKAARVRVSYLFGLIRYRLTYFDGETSSGVWVLWHCFGKQKKESAEPEQDEEMDIEPCEESSNLLSFVQNIVKRSPESEDGESSGLISTIKDFLTYGDFKTIIGEAYLTEKKLFRAVRPGHIDIEGEFGRVDPMETALLYGAYEALSHTFGIRKRVRLAPVFNNESEVLRLKLDVRGWVCIYRLLYPVVRLAAKKPVRDLLLKGDMK